MQPLMTSSPTFASRGRLSPVNALVFNVEFGESTVSKILDLVENSSSKKSRSENFISKFAKYYTPAVCYSALALAVIPPLCHSTCFIKNNNLRLGKCLQIVGAFY